MLIRQISFITAACAVVGSAAIADITVSDAYARVSTVSSKTGAAFMQITNSGDEADRLIAAAGDIAARIELHTHIHEDNGVVRMIEVEEGFEIAADETHVLERGGDHVMLMGLSEPLSDGQEFELTLTFENAGEIVVPVTVDLGRGQGHHHHGSHEMMSN